MTLLDHPSVQDRGLEAASSAFITELKHANRSAHTRRAYASDLASFHRYYSGSLQAITTETLRDYFSTLSGLSPALGFVPRYPCSQAGESCFLPRLGLWAGPDRLEPYGQGEPGED